jgi:ATP-binding cassette, subfamily B, bacterial
MLNARSQKFFSYYKPYSRLLIADLCCAFGVAAVALILPLCARFITKDILAGNAPNVLTQIYSTGALMLFLVVVQTLCTVFVDYQGHMMGALMERDMRAELFEHYQKLSFGFFDNHLTAQLLNRITNDTFSMSELFHHGPEDVVISVLKLIGAFAILINVNVPLTLIIFAFLPIMAVYALYFNKQMNLGVRTSRERIGDVNAQLEDSLAGIRVVKSFTNERVEAKKFSIQNNRFLEGRRIEYKSYMFFSSGMLFFTQFLTIVLLVVGSASIVNQRLDLVDLLTYLLYLGILLEPIRGASNLGRLYQEGITGFNRFMEMLEVRPDIQDSLTATDLVQVHGHLKFQDVSFKYTENHDEVLKNISLEVKAGEFIALVGASGVGKTTLCSLIPRFYDVNEGEILLDGTNITDIRLGALRQHIGIVQQDVYLFAGTVADNIAYGKLGSSLEEIVDAAKKANAHDFIVALPDGYNTDIGQRGVKLSGGQKQRLGIARVFLKNPAIIIFDEATSSLDNESERAVQESLEMLFESRTTIVIAHRLSTIKNAQRIVVLTDQGISEQGTHQELIALGGVYANFYNMQLRM